MIKEEINDVTVTFSDKGWVKNMEEFKEAVTRHNLEKDDYFFKCPNCGKVNLKEVYGNTIINKANTERIPAYIVTTSPDGEKGVARITPKVLGYCNKKCMVAERL